MALPKISEARELTDEQLVQEIIAVKKTTVSTALAKSYQTVGKTHQFRHARHRLAQLLTVEHERKRASVSQAKSEAE